MPALSARASSTTPSVRASPTSRRRRRGEVNLPPSAGLQFFGQVDIDEAEVMTVTLKDLAGAALFSQTLEPQRTGAATP